MDLNCKFIFLSLRFRRLRGRTSVLPFFLSAPALGNNFSARRRLFRSLRSAQSSFGKRHCSQIAGVAGRTEFLFPTVVPRVLRTSVPLHEGLRQQRDHGAKRRNSSATATKIPQTSGCRWTYPPQVTAQNNRKNPARPTNGRSYPRTCLISCWRASRKRAAWAPSICV